MKHIFSLVLMLVVPLGLIAQTEPIRIVHQAQEPSSSEVITEEIPLETADSVQTQDSLVRVINREIRYFTDTVALVSFSPDSVQKQRVDTIRPDSTDRRGHYIEAHVGLGYGSMGYQFSDPNGFGNPNSVSGSFSALLQLQYAYFFHPNWGVGAGLWFTNYTSHAHLGGYYGWDHTMTGWDGLTDTDGESPYSHRADVNRWDERQTIHNIGIPISLQFREQKENWKAGIFASLGLAPSFSVSKKYKVQTGELAHSAYYPQWNLTLDNMHEFVTKDFTQEDASKGQMSVRPQVAIFADLGALIPLTKQIDLLVGGYFNCALNDANSSSKQDVGWKDNVFTFMNDYHGAYAITEAGASHPWEVGVKIGVHWHYIKPDKHVNVDYFEHFMRPDTTIEYVTRQDTLVDEYVETLVRTSIQQAAERVEKFNKIYFALDSYKLTNKAKYYLSSIVKVLNEVPEAKIAIDGHASVEGDSIHNEELSYNRAQAVYKYLVSKGLSSSRVVVLGHGSRIPNEELDGEALKRDRRVEVKVITNEKEMK